MYKRRMIVKTVGAYGKTWWNVYIYKARLVARGDTQPEDVK